MSAERERLVAAIATGLLTDAEARPALGRVREQLDAAAASRELLRFQHRACGHLEAEREHLIALAMIFVPAQKKRPDRCSATCFVRGSPMQC